MYCINLHLIVTPFTFNTDCICKLLYMIDCYTESESKVVQQGLFKFGGFVDVCTQKQKQSKVK